MVDPDTPIDIAATENFFGQNVLGQPEAVGIVSDVIFSLKTFLSRPGKPLASLLFVGPTGVGKTEMAKVLAEFMFASGENMLRFDMSEFADQFSVLRLMGDSLYSEVSDEILGFLCEKGYDSRYGARQLQRAIRKDLLVPLAREMNRGHLAKTPQLSAALYRQKVSFSAPKVSERRPCDQVTLREFAQGRIANYRPDEFAKKVSEFRRAAFMLKEVSSLLQLQRELHILEQRKKNEKGGFWENREQGARYSIALELSGRFSRYFDEIGSFETTVGVELLKN